MGSRRATSTRATSASIALACPSSASRIGCQSRRLVSGTRQPGCSRAPQRPSAPAGRGCQRQRARAPSGGRTKPGGCCRVRRTQAFLTQLGRPTRFLARTGSSLIGHLARGGMQQRRLAPGLGASTYCAGTTVTLISLTTVNEHRKSLFGTIHSHHEGFSPTSEPVVLTLVPKRL